VKLLSLYVEVFVWGRHACGCVGYVVYGLTELICKVQWRAFVVHGYDVCVAWLVELNGSELSCWFWDGYWRATFVKLLICLSLQSPSCEADSCCATKIQCILWATKVHYHVHNTLLLLPILHQKKSSLHPPILFLKDHFKIFLTVLMPSKWLCHLVFPTKNPGCDHPKVYGAEYTLPSSPLCSSSSVTSC